MSVHLMSVFLWFVASLAAACAGPQVAGETSPPLVTTADGHVGTVVRVRGHVVRAKFADLVQGEGLSVYCLGERLPDALIDTIVTVQGTLAERDTGARETPDGAISQGTAPGTTSLVIEGCEVAP
jgi:hypothetical protein